MGNSHMKQHFDNAKKTGVLKISNKLREFPPPLKALCEALRSLDLSENKFEVIPPEIGNFTPLKHLNLSYNKLTSLPEEIGNLTKLETLIITNNSLCTIPMTLSNLSNLKQVCLRDNQLELFPVMFSGLKHLDSLDLSRNKLSVVPHDVASLSVTELILNQNQISHLSERVAECPRLRTLRLEENCLPLDEIHPRILKESKISTLSIEGNLFDNKQFQNIDGYESYMERYTAVKKKML